MATSFKMSISGVDDLERAIKQNPKNTIRKLNIFFVRSIAEYRKIIMRQPWRVGGVGGGAPVDTQALRDSHQSGTKIGKYEASIGPDQNIARYAKYVHGRRKGEINRRTGVKSRPWLDYAFEKADKKVKKLQDTLLKDIVDDLAK